jgi:hypothetical protein
MNTYITNHIISRITSTGMTTSFLSGAALSYSIQTENYSHIPFTLWCPVIYSGYHIFKNKEIIIPYFLTQIPQLKKYNTP